MGSPSRVAHSPTKILGPLRSGLVVVVGLGEGLLGRHVEVLVEHVGRHALDGRGGDDLQIGIALLDGVVELRVAAIVGAGAVEPVFVANFNKVQRERRGVAVFGALGAPLGVGAAGDIFDLVERVLYVGSSAGPGSTCSCASEYPA